MNQGQGRMTPEQANFRRAMVTNKRCGGYAPFVPCSMFLPTGTMLQGNCDAVQVPGNVTDDEHTCDLYVPRQETDDQRDDANGYPDGDADDFRRAVQARREQRLW